MTYNDAIKFLGLEPEAREPDIKKAYRQLAGRLHPDAGGPAHLFVMLREAYEVALRGDCQPRPEEKPNYNYARDYSYTYTHNSKPTVSFNTWQLVKPLFWIIWIALIYYYAADDIMPIYYQLTNLFDNLLQVNKVITL